MTETLRTTRQFLRTHTDGFNEKRHGGIYRRVVPREISGFLSVIVFATSEVTDLITNGGESDPFSGLSHRAYTLTRVRARVWITRDIDRKLESLALQWNSIKLAAEAFEFLSRIGRFHELFGRQSVAGKRETRGKRSFFPKPSPQRSMTSSVLSRTANSLDN